VKIGRPFRIAPGINALARETRQAVTDEIMYKIAELLPAQYRGYYHAVDQVKYQYLTDDL
jgi:hypothetical protein